MNETATNKTVRIIFNSIYGIGAAIVIALCGIALFGSDQPVNPDAMIPLSPKEQAFIWLVFGTIPMLLACMAVYKFNAIRTVQTGSGILPSSSCRALYAAHVRYTWLHW